MKKEVITINLPAFEWNVEAFCGYKPVTTFWQDFSIAELFGLDAVKDTYLRAFREWHTNTEYITELSMVLNHKGGLYYGKNSELANLYFELYWQNDNWCRGNLKDAALDYYYRITN